MNACELSASITAIANTIAGRLSTDEITLLASIFVQLGDTLATIVTAKAMCEEKDKNAKINELEIM